MAPRSDRDWFKSSRSSNNAACVEVRFVDGAVDVRDTKDRTGPILAFDGRSWTSFLTSLKDESAS
ncbi:DUF397 domain-containing protein [Micromonospora endophytica]|uniref:DUF397 domain-containing protein n=1 Tax=Micromonospora endophytica TaxID=515350 RepID=A0A2W2CLE7_9ACTN|nr:DUF397 domain-containing protein [Micromonospora endophytica]PZG00332.1 DUF397 domain-containing protein [Micromonospora endophytica]RIW49892.1 DUF397 domain-containing protein [Micromonospora endophytica]BCJ57163.1 DUF397 domain-containing protein [Micromonospora endophytica]